jgi:hypothetical protein
LECEQLHGLYWTLGDFYVGRKGLNNRRYAK